MIVILGYLALVLSGTTLSSLGVSLLRSNPAQPDGITIGSPRWIRSDEFLTATPIELGFIAGNTTGGSPLVQSSDLIYQLPTRGIAESIAFFDGSVLRLGPVLPDAMLFAAYWWLPTFLLLMSLPVWMNRLGATRRMGWFAAAIFVLAPAAMWWSLMPVRLTAFTVTGCALLLSAVSRLQSGRRATGIALVVAAGVMWARIPTYYVPWSITLGIPVVLATFAYLVWQRDRRRIALIAFGGAAVVALLLFGGVVVENLAALRSELSTVYPGLRVSAGGTVHAANLFGAPLLGAQQDLPTMKGSNPSEISSAYALCAAWALVLWIVLRRRGRGTAESAALGVLAACTAFWLLWCALPWGSLGAMIPLANRVPPLRAAQTVGFLALILVAFVLSRIDSRGPRIAGGIAALTCGALTGLGGLSLRQFIPSTSYQAIAIAALVVAAVVFLVSWLPRNRIVLGVTVLLALSMVYRANPIQIGLGDLRGSQAAQRMLAAGDNARANDQLWVTDTKETAALLYATGVPQLGGYQVTGPVRSEWEKLDPTGAAEKIWNRGASYLIVAIGTSDQPSIKLGKTRDQISLTVNPCQLPSLGFNVRHVLASKPQHLSCLAPAGTLEWAGRTRYLYDVQIAQS